MPSNLPQIAYYVSSHGFGHAARTRTILRKLHRLADVTVFSTIPDWFWEGIPVQHIRYQADTGCAQTGTLTIDVDQTRYIYDQFQLTKDMRLGLIQSIHNDKKFDLFVSDIAPEPLEFASRLGVTAALVANFTWVEIYESMPSMKGLVSELKSQYHCAAKTFIPAFRTSMTWVHNSIVTSCVAELGDSIRSQLDPNNQYHQLIYIDTGRWGTDIGWGNAPDFPTTLFVRVGIPIEGMPPNILQLPFGSINHSDLVKSVDAVISKPGYGIVTECLANQTHWCCIPRSGFAEDSVLFIDAQTFGSVSLVAENSLLSLSFTIPPRKTKQILRFDGSTQISNQLVSLI